ncbi:hypothetical protein [Nocardia harenae]|nr:hypothetical protein [Nocardia harenae]
MPALPGTESARPSEPSHFVKLRTAVRLAVLACAVLRITPGG